MHRPILFAIAAIALFTNVSCPSECEEEFFDRDGGTLTVELSDTGGAFSVGDEFSLSARFPAVQTTPRGNTYTISQAGGLVIVEAFRILPDTNLLEIANRDFTASVPEGELLTVPADTLPRAFRLRYRCPAGNCSFRQTLSPAVPGEYALRVTGGAIDEIGAAFRFCGPPNLENTTVTGGGNFPPDFEGSFLELPPDPQSLAFGTFISPNFHQNVYYFTVD